MSTRNGHFQDAMSLLSAPWTEWPKQGAGVAGEGIRLSPRYLRFFLASQKMRHN